jgi:CubicO group peptidase (beta-lactamase class C family)
MKISLLFLEFRLPLFLLLLLTACSSTGVPCEKEYVKKPVSFFPNPNSEKANKIHELMSTYEAYGKFSGAVLVVGKGKVLYKNGFGLANREWEIPNTTNTKFRLASVTKQFTSMLIMQLVEAGALDLSSPISKWLPDFPKEKGDKITLHQLMTHSSGLPNYTAINGYRQIERDFHRPQEIIDLVIDKPLDFEPGSQVSYSNTGYVVLGLILETISGEKYDDLVLEKIFEPLEMNDSGFDRPNRIIKNRADGYTKNWGEHYNAYFMDCSIAFAAGGLYSTVDDMAKWDKALYTNDLLSEKYREMIFTKHIQEGNSYAGYGWFIGSTALGNSGEEVATVQHSGGINGFRSIITRMPGDGSCIVLLSNFEFAPLYEINRALWGILYDKEFEMPKKSLAESFKEYADSKGFEKAIQFLKENQNNPEYYLNEQELNMEGYGFLEAGQAQKAAEVFKIAVDAFPNSFNTYDSYGEALLSLGQKEKAILNYKKSLELNPENENGKRVLRVLGAGY